MGHAGERDTTFDVSEASAALTLAHLTHALAAGPPEKAQGHRNRDLHTNDTAPCLSGIPGFMGEDRARTIRQPPAQDSRHDLAERMGFCKAPCERFHARGGRWAAGRSMAEVRAARNCASPLPGKRRCPQASLSTEPLRSSPRRPHPTLALARGAARTLCAHRAISFLNAHGPAQRNQHSGTKHNIPPARMARNTLHGALSLSNAPRNESRSLRLGRFRPCLAHLGPTVGRGFDQMCPDEATHQPAYRELAQATSLLSAR